MDITIKTIHFSISNDLEDFATKKITKAASKREDIVSAKVIMELIKPETNNNKEVEIIFGVKGSELFSKKTADTFEEAFDLALDAVKKQYSKYKEKKS